MKAITTTFLGCTSKHPSRIKATAEGVKPLLAPYDVNLGNPHAIAAVNLCNRMNWGGELIHGSTPQGEVFVFTGRYSDRPAFVADLSKSE